ncbi:MAG: cryptochrome/photolyase family protein [Streptosporangiales bacterium]
MASEAALWLFGDQLGPHFHRAPTVRRLPVLLIESRRALGRRPTHRQKLHLVVSGMRHLAHELGDRATLLCADTYREGLLRYGRPVVVYEPGSRAAAGLVERLRDVVQEILPTPGFLLSRTEFNTWAAGRERFRMEDFYGGQREAFDVLLRDGEPVGGRLSYDTENRESPPKDRERLDLRRPYRPREDAIDAQVRSDLDGMAADRLIQPAGRDARRVFPASRREARRALATFTAHRLPHFGPLEDAMLADDPAMTHSLLSAPLNLGLLSPREVIAAAESRYWNSSAPLRSVEGFIRQVLGWREYVWQLYWYVGPGYLERNALDATAPLPRWWRELDADAVEARCLRTTLTAVRDRGWVHHIQRLMVLGNHALQRGYDPAELTDWFATAFVDGTPWVMPVNVIGMSQYADGGLVTTKPYAAGGAYINRMSDYCRDCRYDPKVRLGADACPFTAGYWSFVDRHRDRLATNPRTSRAVASARRLSDLSDVLAQESGRTTF